MLSAALAPPPNLALRPIRPVPRSMARRAGLGASLDHWDQRLSQRVFRLNLPKWLELILSVPGALMGFPHAFFGPTPLALAAAATPSAIALKSLLLSSVLGAGRFYAGLAGWINFTKTTKLLIFLMPGLCLVLSSKLSPEAAYLSQCSLICASLAVAVSIPLKALADRPRPATNWAEKTRRSALLWPYIEAMCKGGQSREALPSSDAAVMAANAFLLWRFWHHPAAPWVALIFFAFACFGRMYFWAHHCFDVLSGGFLGVLVTLCVLHFQWVSTHHFLLSFLVFLVAVAAMQKRTRIFDERKDATASSRA